MIYSDSRYASGDIFKAQDARTAPYQTTVTRVFPEATADFYYYTWVEGDRIDELAYKMYSNSDFWWTIMDFNPEVSDALNIAPGTILRMPIV